MIWVSPSSLLATGVAIVVRGKLLLTCETEKGALQLPGYFVEEGKRAISLLQTFLSKNNLNELPQQTLYISEIKLRHPKKTEVTGVVTVINLPKALGTKMLNCKYLTGKQLSRDERANGLLKAVAQWLSNSL